MPFQASSATSYQGAKRAEPKAGTQKAVVLEAIRQHGPISDHEIEKLTGYALNIVNARRHMLMKDGLVMESGTHAGPFGVRNTVYIVAPENQ